MADLLSTTVNGKITVTDTAKIGQATFTASSDSRLNITGVDDLQLDSTSLLRPQGLYYGDQKIAKTNIAPKDNTSNYYTYLSPVTATGSRLGGVDQRWGITYASIGDFSEQVNAPKVILDNTGAIAALKKDSQSIKERVTLMYLSANDHINIGGGSDYPNPGNIYLNAKKGIISLISGAGTATLGKDTKAFFPETSGGLSLGSADYKWYNVWITGKVNTSSDIREKNNVVAIKDYAKDTEEQKPLFEKLFNRLNPVTYYFNNDDPQRHIGFIAQDVAKITEDLGADENDFAFLTHSIWTDEETGEEKDRYSIAYSEFIALNTYMIQKQQKTIENLEQKIEKLEKQLSEVK